MRGRFVLVVAFTILTLTGCNSENGGTQTNGPEGPDDPISSDEVNRYQITLGGDVDLDHTGGLRCWVDDEALSMDFGIDAYNGPVNYVVTVPDFDPANTALEGTFTFNDASDTSEGPVELTFSIGDPPEGYAGDVRAAGLITGSMSGDAGTAEVNASYACFLMHSEVGL